MESSYASQAEVEQSERYSGGKRQESHGLANLPRSEDQRTALLQHLAMLDSDRYLVVDMNLSFTF